MYNFLFVVSSGVFKGFFTLVRNGLNVVVDAALNKVVLNIVNACLPLAVFSNRRDVAIIGRDFTRFTP